MYQRTRCSCSRSLCCFVFCLSVMTFSFPCLRSPLCLLPLRQGTLLPAGALACVWIYGLHRHPALWESPNAFLPERWLEGARQASILTT